MILGSFFLRMTNNGNLLGEFCNNTLSTSSTESADRISNLSERTFVGTYNSTWFNNGAEAYILDIQSLPEPATVFILEWTNRITNNIFRGEGFLIGEMLIGSYWDIELQNELGGPLR
ncbi:hypothetical protein [Arenibacter sp. S6351L]|uniref:hypothetical protein n=1 Tax=Arenibacter sp. S6351L TaxID=2926407 RepID=UPI001FF217D1|nr:hypothetical protein [Arenibacter sp. S6351L]